MLNLLNLSKETFFYGVLVFLVVLSLINFIQYMVVYNNLDDFKADPLKVSVHHVYDQNVRVFNYWKNLGGERAPALKTLVGVAAVAAPFVGAAFVTYLSMNWYQNTVGSGLLSSNKAVTEY